MDDRTVGFNGYGLQDMHCKEKLIMGFVLEVTKVDTFQAWCVQVKLMIVLLKIFFNFHTKLFCIVMYLSTEAIHKGSV